MSQEDRPPEERHEDNAPTETVAIAEVRELDIDGIWSRIEAVPGPGPDPALPWERPATRGQRYVPWGLRARKGFVLAILALVAVAIGLPFISPWLLIASAILISVAGVVWTMRDQDRAITRATSPAEARTQWEHRLKRFREEDTEAAFHARREALRTVRDELRGLLTAETGRHPKFLELSKLPQRNAYLAGFALADAQIPELDESSREILLGASVLTAAEADPDTVGSLLEHDPDGAAAIRRWRSSIAKRFRPTAAAPLSSAEAAAVADEFSRWQKGLVQTYTAGVRRLENLSKHIAKERPASVRYLHGVWEGLQMVERRQRRPGTTSPPATRRKGAGSGT